MTTMHLAELNIARLRYPIDDPRVAEFADNLDRINAAAERSTGFVWRLKDEVGNATSMAVGGDPMVIPNLSVWETVGDLETFVFKTVHKRIYDRRAEWFSLMEKMHFVMWFVPAGTVPSLQEALERLDHLNTHGATDRAFDWRHLPEAQLWRTARCEQSAA